MSCFGKGAIIALFFVPVTGEKEGSQVSPRGEQVITEKLHVAERDPPIAYYWQEEEWLEVALLSEKCWPSGVVTETQKP